MQAYQTVLWSVLVVLGAFPLAALAQAASASAAAAQTVATTEGEVRRLDKMLGTLTIRHGEIRNLDMPPMSMVFTARDKAQLDAMSVGDRIRFVATNENGKFIASEIDVVR
ncbi:copper-binding protein [Pigmentiphaga aceris]|uniref:Copper-binding protein n=1 Tax=Pigmentiphaga aceris TaxID=1940612 RepID=A0A5C0ASL4_9BURK|nr:copper-binding protein [Pigmentiphaga aceris]QEI05262.1 copper-binding protein [Pigmentiphaga aceris]